MKTIIVDDERLARKELRSLLEKFPEIVVIDECSNAMEAKSSIERNDPDLVFLDIQMPGKTGFDLINDLDVSPRIVFVTAYDEYALKAFEVNAVDYLLKPVSPERIEECIKKMLRLEAEKQEKITLAQTARLTENDRIFLKDGEKCWFVQLSDIRVFESEGNYVRVYFNDCKPLILKSLNTLEDRLDEKTFFRANRKFIINLSYLQSIETWFNGGLMVTLKNGEKVEISRRQAVRFKDLMSL
ncbi:MAG TPA: LytTR family transcriptional regulator DNA-binding domain-containing protein [Flavobacteriales bacterium]|nr:LytTR family transcriptional regulator DNA-binding domain-containing protein [Flavobacteriales bacterium]